MKESADMGLFSKTSMGSDWRGLLALERSAIARVFSNGRSWWRLQSRILPMAWNKSKHESLSPTPVTIFVGFFRAERHAIGIFIKDITYNQRRMKIVYIRTFEFHNAVKLREIA